MSSSGQKPSVAQTCNLLSQYFKENGRFANKGVETLNLLPNLENSAEISRVQNVKASDFFANMPTFASNNSVNEARTEHGSSQMTIIYAGKVFVFNDTSAEKAKEIMALATKASSSNAVVNPELNNNSQTVPIARRASLHRFFEKRKDRAIARAPYQVNCPYSSVAPAAAAAPPPPKPKDQSKYSWLHLEGQSSSKQLDLNL